MELRLLCRRGYAEAEIVAVCSKYDLDKGHVLSAAEVRKMQSDLDRKKVKIQQSFMNIGMLCGFYLQAPSLHAILFSYSFIRSFRLFL